MVIKIAHFCAYAPLIQLFILQDSGGVNDKGDHEDPMILTDEGNCPLKILSILTVTLPGSNSLNTV